MDLLGVFWIFLQFLTIFAWVEDEDPKSFFDANTEICCQGQVYQNTDDIPNPTNRRCCAGSLFNELDFLCCNGTLHPRSEDPSAWLDCCDLLVYNKKTDACCEGNIIPKPNDNVDSPLCCGKSIFDPMNQLCCSGTIVEKIGIQPDCCGMFLVDLQTQVCCEGNILPKDEFTACCRAEAYNLNEQVCCADGTLLPIPEGIAAPSCCGEQVFDASDGQHCCHNMILPKDQGCCGAKIYNMTNHICCSVDTSLMVDSPSVIHPRDPNEDLTCCGNQPSLPGVGCCGGVFFNENIYTCCRGNLYIFDPNQPHRRHCCFSDIDSIIQNFV